MMIDLTRLRLVDEEIRQAEKCGMSRKEYRKWQNKKYYTPLQIYDMLETIPIRGGVLVRKKIK